MQASRRLARRINQELQAHHDGYVQVAAQAFVYLLQHLPAEDSSLFARELVAQHVVCTSCLFTTLVGHSVLMPTYMVCAQQQTDLVHALPSQIALCFSGCEQDDCDCDADDKSMLA